MKKLIILIANAFGTAHKSISVPITYNRQFARRQWKESLRGSPAWKNGRQAGRRFSFRTWLGHKPAYNDPVAQ